MAKVLVFQHVAHELLSIFDPMLRDAKHRFQWHGRTYDTPKSAINLMSSELARNQAFHYGDKVYGFQFHLEVIEPVINRWLSLDMHKEDLIMCASTIMSGKKKKRRSNTFRVQCNWQERYLVNLLIYFPTWIKNFIAKQGVSRVPFDFFLV